MRPALPLFCYALVAAWCLPPWLARLTASGVSTRPGGMARRDGKRARRRRSGNSFSTQNGPGRLARPHPRAVPFGGGQRVYPCRVPQRPVRARRRRRRARGHGSRRPGAVALRPPDAARAAAQPGTRPGRAHHRPRPPGRRRRRARRPAPGRVPRHRPRARRPRPHRGHQRRARRARPPQLAAVLAHERAHLAARHHAIVTATRAPHRGASRGAPVHQRRAGIGKAGGDVRRRRRRPPLRPRLLLAGLLRLSSSSP
jgi:hypothetical protein